MRRDPTERYARSAPFGAGEKEHDDAAEREELRDYDGNVVTGMLKLKHYSESRSLVTCMLSDSIHHPMHDPDQRTHNGK